MPVETLTTRPGCRLSRTSIRPAVGGFTARSHASDNAAFITSPRWPPSLPHHLGTHVGRNSGAMRGYRVRCCDARRLGKSGLFQLFDGAPYWTRTSDPQLRRLLLYPSELRALNNLGSFRCGLDQSVTIW